MMFEKRRCALRPLAISVALLGTTIIVPLLRAQAPVIVSVGRDGDLVVSNIVPGTAASVEWAPTVTGPWTNSWAGLAAVTADAHGMLSVRLPMFYRIRGHATPAGMNLVPAGVFTMGDVSDGDGYALPLHEVQISAFYMDRCEVTKALWDEVYQWAITNGYGFSYDALGKGTNHPAHSVTWYDAVKWCNARSEREGRIPAYYTDSAQTIVYRTNVWDIQNNRVKWTQGYRLPTEAEWEKAARGGTPGHRFAWTNMETISHGQANYYAAVNFPFDLSYPIGYHPDYAIGGEPYTSPVASFAPNGYGFYDMTGNISEWCWDYDGGYATGPQTDPHGPLSGGVPYSYRMKRGGAWTSFAVYCPVAFRDFDLPNQRRHSTGFRCVLPVPSP